MYAANGQIYALFSHDEVSQWSSIEARQIADAAKALYDAQIAFNATYKPAYRHQRDLAFDTGVLLFNAWQGWQWIADSRK